MITFKAPIIDIKGWKIIHLPENISFSLPSRGMVMVEGVINDATFQAALEPDGHAGHWLHLETPLLQKIKAGVGDEIKLAIEPSKDWPEPNIPADIKRALDEHDDVFTLWSKITPMARWDWIRWIQGTSNAKTREHRIEVAFSKLRAGERRPCCFNRSACTVPEVSKGGVLLQQALV